MESNHRCFKTNHHIVRVYGFTKDPELGDYMLVMEYEEGGDLHNYLQKEFTNIKWNEENGNKLCILYILWQIAAGYLYFKYIFIYYLLLS